MLLEIDPSISQIVKYFSMTLERLQNDEVLYKDEEKYKTALADYLSIANSLKGLFDAKTRELDAQREETRKANAIIKSRDKQLDELWQKHEQLMIVNREYRRDYTSKPVREVVKVVAMRNQPRDAHDIAELAQTTENLIFRMMHDKSYQPDELYHKKYKSKLKSTLHLDINI
jgi:hypothetical protein